MRSRVAFIATLLALVILAVLFTRNCIELAESKNGEMQHDLQILATVAGDLSREDSMKARADKLETIATSRKVFKGLYTADGSAYFTSDESYPKLSDEDISAASADQASVILHDRPDGKDACYAIYHYEDGAFLLFSRENATLTSVLLGSDNLIWLIAASLVSVMLVLSVLIYTSRRERRIDDIMQTLDRFADGDFDARIPSFSGKDKEIAEYNAIISSIQERIFKQKNRNYVIGSVMAQMQNGIIAVDQDLRVIFLTSVAKQLLGITGNVEGHSINVASKDVRLDEVFSEAMHQSGVYTNEVAARTTMGRGHRPLRLYVSPMKQGTKVVGALAIVEDITELRRLEQVRTDFAANVSHELKTPLTSIRGFVETLQAGAIDNPEMAHKFLNIIYVETERLTRLINDILSISKLESGDTEVATERIRLDKKAFDICEMLTINAREKQVTLNYHLNEKPVFIMGNPDRVEQLLINLTENAIKYNVPGGSVTVQVFADENEANVTISDTGIGIAEENLPRLFERFYRVDKGRSRQMGGTGLGLAIVKHIVRSMKGEIEVHSKLGEGTEFLVTLPLAPKENPEKDTIFEE